MVMKGRNFDLVSKVLDRSAVSSSDHFRGLDAAATKLQKAYKIYRTRRNLAGCAVVVEELWWKALDFAALRRCSISFFDSERSETAVGKGLSKSQKARKLDLTQWLEAIDPRHRYGRNLHFYYNVWFHSDSSQPFFYWLDIGDGKGANLGACSRTQLQCQRVKYLGKQEREEYEVIVEAEKLIYKKSRLPVDTFDGSKWIFVLSASRKLYVGKKQKGLFQHSSFLSGGAAIAAGRLVARGGFLEAIWTYSGHYRPPEENFQELISFLEEQLLDLTDVKKCPMDDDIPPSTASFDDNESNGENGGSIYAENSSSRRGGEDAVAISIADYPNGEDRGALVL
ncbi:hypothetical protein POTOM_013263 [Populus tomentosa]|uniref:Calmodulin-binding family protein n=1 Tax=Populus tomentosa TaxID=118781 RepID=A0A8X8A294_POPTO|nr:hypothetical protein POTOM_013263 [Populus tomentosa]